MHITQIVNGANGETIPSIRCSFWVFCVQLLSEAPIVSHPEEASHYWVENVECFIVSHDGVQFRKTLFSQLDFC